MEMILTFLTPVNNQRFPAPPLKALGLHTVRVFPVHWYANFALFLTF